MNEYRMMIRRTVRFTLVLAVFWAVLWAVVPMWRPIFSGLTIGTATSLYFAVSAARQAETAGDAALHQTGKKPILQASNRMLMIAAAVLISQAVTERWGYVNVPAMLMGMFTYQTYVLGVCIHQLLSNK